jgi:hypothetical protein
MSRGLGLLLALGLVAAGCGGSTGSDSASDDAPTATSTSLAAGAESASESDGEQAEKTETPDDEATTEAEADGYLPAEDVPAYVASYESAQATSYLSIDGTEEPFLTASAQESLEFTTASSALTAVIGDDGIEGSILEYQGSLWQQDGEPEYSAVPDELDEEFGEGDILELSFPMSNVEDKTDVIDVRMLLDVNLLGGGSSVVETKGHYALISGTLGSSTYVQLRDIMANEPNVDTLVLTQVDGSENDEINVHTARLIRDAGWTTWVAANGDISSGGVDMFTAGVERYLEAGAFVGVHSWAGDDGSVGSDFPEDDPAHRSQLEYFRAMLGDEAGPEFYFYTLEAAEASSIHRMSIEEISTYGLTTGEPPAPLPAEIVGELAAGYLEIFEGAYLKVLVESCDFDGSTGAADLISLDLGELAFEAENGSGQAAFADLGADFPSFPVSNVVVANGQLAADIALDLGDMVAADTSSAHLEIPCVN